MSPRRRRRGNTWTQVGVSVCVLLLPPILAVAVFAPRPLPRAGYAPGVSQPVEQTSAPLPLTEGSFRPPSQTSFQPPIVDPKQFVDRFEAAFDRGKEIGGPLPPIPDEQSVPEEPAPPERPVMAVPEALFYHRHSRTGENRILRPATHIGIPNSGLRNRATTIRNDPYTGLVQPSESSLRAVWISGTTCEVQRPTANW